MCKIQLRKTINIKEVLISRCLRTHHNTVDKTFDPKNNTHTQTRIDTAKHTQKSTTIDNNLDEFQGEQKKPSTFQRFQKLRFA